MFSLAFERHHAATRLYRRASGCRTATRLPSPKLAAILGFIPGVGAMYNGEFAKGFIHVLIFATLIWMTDHVSGIFGLGIAAFVIYMPIEAYQTARAREMGLPAPDPFGFNHLFSLGHQVPARPAAQRRCQCWAGGVPILRERSLQPAPVEERRDPEFPSGPSS